MKLATVVTSAILLGISATAAEAQKAPGKERNVITQAEIQKAGAQSPHEVISKLRPTWFSSRGAVLGQASTKGRQPGMSVYLDGVLHGGVGDLETLPIEQVAELRFLSSEEAVTRFGPDNPLGAIEVVTKRGLEVPADSMPHDTSSAEPC
jgi:hypothetical protein